MTRKKVWEFFGMHIIAINAKEAAAIIRGELGGLTPRSIKRSKGPFVMGYQGGPYREVTEDEYVDGVSTYGGGIVKEGE